MTRETDRSESIPRGVADAVRTWDEHGRSEQMGIRWPRDRWLQRFPESRAHFDSLPDLLDRAAVHDACQLASESASRAIEAFLTVMAWGYGTRTGYGPYRTQTMLDLRDAGDRLQRAARRVREEGALAGYDALRSDCRIRGLGPAFGTKYLYFCSSDDAGAKALILDRLVAGFLSQEAGMRLNPVPWSRTTYEQYVTNMRSWSHELSISPEQLEMCIFAEESRRLNNQWAT